MRATLTMFVLALASVGCGSKPTGGGQVDASIVTDTSIDTGTSGTADAALDATVMMVTCTANQACNCNPGEACDLQCPAGNCQIVCEPGAVCTIGCAGGGCQIDCQDNARCAVDCAGGGCTTSADPGASLTVNCGGPGNCDTQCDMGVQCAETCTTNCQLDCGGSTMCTQTCTSGCTCAGC